jgi:hypothetical protein
VHKNWLFWGLNVGPITYSQFMGKQFFFSERSLRLLILAWQVMFCLAIGLLGTGLKTSSFLNLSLNFLLIHACAMHSQLNSDSLSGSVCCQATSIVDGEANSAGWLGRCN